MGLDVFENKKEKNMKKYMGNATIMKRSLPEDQKKER